MKDYLIETFQFNDEANKQVLAKIKLLDDKNECIRLFSHLINCQYKWMARIMKEPGYDKMSWWEPVYDLNELEKEWDESLNLWVNYLDKATDENLCVESTFTGFDNSIWAATPKDIALQLNYHSIHHRAQMQSLIRQQGVEPDFVDYIGTKYRKISQ